MKAANRDELMRDVRAGALAARRRTGRVVRDFLVGGCALGVGLLALLQLSADRPVEAEPVMARVPAPAPVPESPTRREKDEALLETLADAGPLIITMPDGSRQLHLTRH